MSARSVTRGAELVKRLFDIGVATAGLVVLFPLLVFIAILSMRKLGSPVLFVQERVGRDGAIFRMVKFRTMKPLAQGELPGAESDARRLTSYGRLLRSTSMDELPELWNVVRGEMSLVGPRPLLPEYLPLYSERQSRRHEVRPGITGLAQVSGRNAIDWASRLELDVRYVEQRSFSMDLRILVLTIVKVFRRDGVGGDGVETMQRFTGTGS